MITIEDIRRNRVLSNFYRSVDDFRETLETDLANWSAAENGNLTYNFEVNRKSFDIVFAARRQLVNRADKRINQMGRNFELQLDRL